MEEYPAYNFGVVGVFEVGPTMQRMRNKLALGAALAVLLALLGGSAGGAAAAEGISQAEIGRASCRERVLRLV